MSEFDIFVRGASEGIPVTRVSKRYLTPKEEVNWKKGDDLGLPQNPNNPRWIYEKSLRNWAYVTHPDGTVEKSRFFKYIACHYSNDYRRCMTDFALDLLTSYPTYYQLLSLWSGVFQKLIANEIGAIYPIAVPQVTIYNPFIHRDDGVTGIQVTTQGTSLSISGMPINGDFSEGYIAKELNKKYLRYLIDNSTLNNSLDIGCFNGLIGEHHHHAMWVICDEDSIRGMGDSFAVGAPVHFGNGLSCVGTWNSHKVYQCDWLLEVRCGGMLWGCYPDDWALSGSFFCPHIPLDMVVSRELFFDYTANIGSRFGMAMGNKGMFFVTGK